MQKEIHIKANDLFLEFEGNFALSARGDYIMAYKLDYEPRYTQGQNELTRLKDAWDRALDLLPIGTIVCKSDVFKKQNFDAGSMPNDNFLQRSTVAHFDNREYIGHDGWLFFVFSKNNTMKNNQIKNPFSFLTTKQIETDNSNLAAFKVAVNECVANLNRSGQISVGVAEPEDMISFCENWLNGLNDKFATDFIFDKDFATTDQKKIGIFSLNNEISFPETIAPIVEDDVYSTSKKNFSFYKGLFDDLGITLKFAHIVNNIIFIDDHNTYVNELYKNKDNLHAVRKFGHQNVIAKERVEDYLKDILTPENEKLKFVRGNTTVIYFADSEEEYQDAKTTISSLIEDTRIKAYVPEGVRLKNLYLNTLFVNAPVLDNKSCYLVDLRVATCLFIANGGYKDDKEGIYFQDRIWNIPHRFDWWDAGKKRLVSRNFGVFAPTGRGKSVLCEEIISSFINEQKGIAVIVDIGHSYEKLCKLFPQDQIGYFKYEEGQPLGLNPFALKEGTLEVGELKIETVAETVWVLIKKTGAPSDLERTSLRKIIDAYYFVMLKEKAYDQLSWQSFYDFVMNLGKDIYRTLDIEEEFFNLKEFKHAGSEFTKNGIYKHIFEQDQEAQKNSFKHKKLVLFELDKLQDNPLLLIIMVQVIFNTISEIIWDDRSTRGMVFFDEFAKTLQFAGMVERVSFYAQAIRKQEGSLGLVLQTAEQFPDNELSRSILANIETILLLPTDDDIVIESLAKRKSLSTHDKCQIRSMQHNFHGKRKYSEFFIKRGDNFSMVYRLELAKEVLLAFETEGDRAEAMMNRYNEIGDMEQVINEYIN